MTLFVILPHSIIQKVNTDMQRRFKLILSFIAMAMAIPLFMSAEDWPQFRGPTGQGMSTAKNLPVEWSATKNVAWKAEIPGQGWSSPVLAEGKLYLTAAVGAKGGPVTLHAICVLAKDGSIVWDKEVFRPDPAAVKAMHSKNSPASATPIVTKDKLYVHFGHLGTAALDLSGKILWTQTTLKYSPVHGNGGSPLLLDDKLIFSCDGGAAPFIVALDAASGEVKWKTPRETKAKRTFSFCTPLAIDVDGVTQVILPGSGFVGGYDPADGHELWRVRYGEGYSVVPRPLFANGLLFVSSGFDAAVVYAIRPKSAAGDVTDKNVVWKQRLNAPKTPSMLVVGDELYYVSDDGTATCADARTSEVYWTYHFSGGFSASLVSADGRIYFQNEAGVGYVTAADKHFTLLSENDLGERSLASMAVTDGSLFLRTEKHLWKIAGK